MLLSIVNKDSNSKNNLLVVPSTFLSFIGCASWIEILNLYLEPIALLEELRSTTTILLRFFFS